MKTLFIMTACCLCGPRFAGADEMQRVTSFEAADEIGAVRPHNAKVQPTSERATDGKQALRVEFLPGEWPHAAVRSATAWDWRRWGRLALDITNPGDEPIEFGVRVDDDRAADGAKHCRQGLGTIEPGATATFTLGLDAAADPMRYGMRGLPPVPGTRGLTKQATGAIELGHIVAFQVFLGRPTRPRVLFVDHVRLLPAAPPPEGIVDAFGQYAKSDWPGKLKGIADFAARRAAEDDDLKAHPPCADRDRYGGWAKGPQRDATGWFRAERLDGRWWLVTPDGHLFLSLGVDCVNTYEATITTGREQMFTWLPAAGDPLARHFGRVASVHSGPVHEGTTFNFLTANLERKYGRDYEAIWLDRAVTRLLSWGFNTVGNWSSRNLYRNGRIPYVATVHITGDHARLSSGSDYWGRMHDPFDPRFAEAAARSIGGQAAQVKDDPWCLGWFVDNELSWGGWGDDSGRYGLARGALAGPETSPAKQAFLARLQARYGTVDRLNQAWGTAFADWDALKPPYTPPSPPPEAMKSGMSDYGKEFARRYFRVVRDELRKAAPHHLYLGCRFAWRTPEAVEAAAEICDVVSFNIYQPRIDPKEWSFLADLGKPCILGEFHFGALDRGMFHTGLVAVPDQAARAAMYRDYLHSVIDHPALVGCHWFQYVDQPLTGRTLDGENYNIGLLTVTDTPYPEMIAAARAVHREAYERRGKAKP